MSAAVPLYSPALPRRASVVLGVIAAHIALLWWAQRASLVQHVETVVPVQLLDAVLTPPEVPPPAPVARPKVQPRQQPKPQHREEPPPARAMPTPPARPPQHAPAPRPRARPPVPPPVAARTEAPTLPTPAPAAPTVPAALAPSPPAAAPMLAAPPAPPAPAAAAAAAKVDLPISDADYLQNPKPEWPHASQRLGEKGLVVLRVLIGTDGRARKAEIAQSSGYPRLDNASLAAVLQWRYVPGKRGGVPEEMWVKVPIRWGD